jgi:hypothetical protein
MFRLPPPIGNARDVITRPYGPQFSLTDNKN